MRAEVLTCVPVVATPHVEHGDLRVSVLDAGSRALGKSSTRPTATQRLVVTTIVCRYVACLRGEQVQRHEIVRPIGRPALLAVDDELDGGLGLVGVDELTEKPTLFRVFYHLAPFAAVGVQRETEAVVPSRRKCRACHG